MTCWEKTGSAEGACSSPPLFVGWLASTVQGAGTGLYKSGSCSRSNCGCRFSWMVEDMKQLNQALEFAKERWVL